MNMATTPGGHWESMVRNTQHTSTFCCTCKGNVRCRILSLSTLVFETDSFTDQELLSRLGWLASGFPVPVPQHWDYKLELLYLALLCGF